METKDKKQVKEEKAICNDVKCPVHGGLKVRGRMFKGYVIRKFSKRIVIEFERVAYVPKYERYKKKKTTIHARLPDCQAEKVKIGDYVLVGECRPLSKIIHFVYINNVEDKSKGEKK